MGVKTVFSASTIEENGYVALLWNGHVLFIPKGCSLDTAMVLGVRVENVYRQKGQPM
jgi:hypothetical protein